MCVCLRVCVCMRVSVQGEGRENRNERKKKRGGMDEKKEDIIVRNKMK